MSAVRVGVWWRCVPWASAPTPRLVMRWGTPQGWAELDAGWVDGGFRGGGGGREKGGVGYSCRLCPSPPYVVHAPLCILFVSQLECTATLWLLPADPNNIGLQSAGELLGQRFGIQSKYFWAVGLFASGQVNQFVFGPLGRHIAFLSLLLSAAFLSPG